MNIDRTSNPQRSWQVATIAAIGFAIVWNFFTNTFPPTGVSIAKLSSTVFANVKIIPANYAFAIWGLIYLGLVTFGFYQLNPQRANNSTLQQIRPWIILVSLLQSGWILLFLYLQMFLSTLVMLGILGGLIKCYRSLNSPDKYTSRSLPIWIPQVFSLYLGWITVATIVNIASTFDRWGWQGSPLSPDLWTLLLIAVSVGLAMFLYRTYGDIVFGGVIVWAIGGIVIANLTAPIISIGGLIAIAILASSLLWQARTV
jgi:hypothetical protein